MSKEEAAVQMKLLQLQLARIREEVEKLKECFCKKNDHCWRREWQESGDRSGLFAVTHYFCYLCGVWKPLGIDGLRCHICNEKINGNGGTSEEDVCSCPYCGHNNTMDPRGIRLRNIPKRI